MGRGVEGGSSRERLVSVGGVVAASRTVARTPSMASVALKKEKQTRIQPQCAVKLAFCHMQTS